MTIKYQLYWNVWWFACQGRWMGYYPASLFMGNQSVFSTLVDHVDHIGFWGEVFDSDDIDGRTSTDMGSGYFAEVGWPWSGYIFALRLCSMAAWPTTTAPLGFLPRSRYPGPLPQRFWLGSYVFVGGPGAG
jgi:hypothetical protein